MTTEVERFRTDDPMYNVKTVTATTATTTTAPVKRLPDGLPG